MQDTEGKTHQHAIMQIITNEKQQKTTKQGKIPYKPSSLKKY